MIFNQGQSESERSTINNYTNNRHNQNCPHQIKMHGHPPKKRKKMYGHPTYNVLLFCPNTYFPALHSAPRQASKTQTDLIPHKHTKHLMPLFPGCPCQIPYFLWLISSLIESNTQNQIGMNLQEHTSTLDKPAMCLTGAFYSKIYIWQNKIKGWNNK